MKYTIEFLAKKFREHEKHAKKINEELIRNFLVTHKESELPGHFKNDFSIPAALATICEEIVLLKKRMEE